MNISGTMKLISCRTLSLWKKNARLHPERLKDFKAFIVFWQALLYIVVLKEQLAKYVSTGVSRCREKTLGEDYDE
jgi:hypothetical protein